MKLFNGGKIYNKILVIPDMHMPFIDKNALRVVALWKRNHNPDLIIQLGDLFDFKAWSRWPKDADDDSPHLEFEKAMQQAASVSKLIPNMEILFGNHDMRVAKRALEVGFTRHIMRDLSEIFRYPGWHWHADPKAKLIVNTPKGPVWFLHGDEMGGNAAQKSRLLGISIVQGHSHQASITHSNGLSHAVYGMETGHIMDMESKGAQYAFRSGRYPVMGFGIIKYGIPYFINIDGSERKI